PQLLKFMNQLRQLGVLSPEKQPRHDMKRDPLDFPLKVDLSSPPPRVALNDVHNQRQVFVVELRMKRWRQPAMAIAMRRTAGVIARQEQDVSTENGLHSEPITVVPGKVVLVLGRENPLVGLGPHQPIHPTQASPADIRNSGCPDRPIAARALRNEGARI